MSDDDIDGQVEVGTKSPAAFFVTARKRLTKKAGVEWTQNWTSGDGGYDAELKEARLNAANVPATTGNQDMTLN